MKTLKTIFILSLVYFSSLFAKTITLVTDDGPPHMIKESNSGIDIDIARDILERLGHKVIIKYVPLKRASLLVEYKRADGVFPTFFGKDRKNFYPSNPMVQYKPTVFSLKSKNYNPKNISSLEKYKIVTFQGATGYFGKKFVEISKTAKEYKEFYDMSKLPNLLERDRYDIVVLDYYIFYYYYRFHNKEKDTSIFKIHNIIPGVSASIAFNDKNIRDEFNKELKKYISEGKRKKIIEKYIGNIK